MMCVCVSIWTFCLALCRSPLGGSEGKACKTLQLPRYLAYGSSSVAPNVRLVGTPLKLVKQQRAMPRALEVDILACYGL